MKRIIDILILFVLFICFANIVSFAQVKVLGMDQYIGYANIVKNSGGANNKYSDMKGSPFLNEEFEEGRVHLRNGKIYEGPLRYDIYSDQIEFKSQQGEIFEIRNPESVEKVSMGKHNYLCFIKGEERLLDGIYEELVNGDYTLLVKHKVILKDAVPAKPYVEARPATFIKKKSEYFVLDSNGENIPINNKNDLLELGDNPSEVKTFMKKNKTSFNDKEAIVAVLDYLNRK